MEVVDSDGVVHEAETLAEAASELIERPPYWRKAGHVEEGEWGRTFDKAFLAAQIEIGPLSWADADNSFSESKYSTLGALLAKAQPILNRHGFIVNFGAGKVTTRLDAGAKYFLPIWLKLTHVDSGEWKRVFIELPILKFDPQSFGGLVTYGRRYNLAAHLSIAATDDDGVMASSLPKLDGDQLEEMLGRMFDRITQCKDEPSLRKWHKENEQQFAMLGEEGLARLRAAWQKRLNETKEAVQDKKVKKNGQPSQT